MLSNHAAVLRERAAASSNRAAVIERAVTSGARTGVAPRTSSCRGMRQNGDR